MYYYIEMNSEIDKLFIIVKDLLVCKIFIGEDDFQEWKRKQESLSDLEGLVVSWKDYVRKMDGRVKGNETGALLEKTVVQFNEYFQGNRKNFDLPLNVEGTKFQKSVWNVLMQIPYGEVRSYQQVAEMIGNRKAVRAVGGANRANDLPIIIPCHRVIGKTGKLVGYAGSRTDIKEKLLKIEGFIQ